MFWHGLICCNWDNRYLPSPTMHGDEQKCVDEAIQTNGVSKVGTNIIEVDFALM